MKTSLTANQQTQVKAANPTLPAQQGASQPPASSRPPEPQVGPDALQSRYRVHPVCALFPDMTSREFAELKASIRMHGQLEPIVVEGNQLLDGRHRLRACLELGLEPLVIPFSELCLKVHPAAWVLTTNVRRRNLTDDQRLAVLSKYNDWAKRPPANPNPQSPTATASEPTDDASSEDPGRTSPAQSHADDSQRDESPGRNRPKNSSCKRRKGRPAGRGGGRKREQLAQAAGQSAYRARQMLQLSKEAPDLATAIEEGRLSLREGMKQLKARQARPVRPPKIASLDRALSWAEQRLADKARQLSPEWQVSFWEHVQVFAKRQRDSAGVGCAPPR